MTKVINHSLFSEFDLHLFRSGKHFSAHKALGSHVITLGGKEGTHFAVWAPNARVVSIIGDFNEWNSQSHLLISRKDGSGIWEGFIPAIGKGVRYKYHIISSTGQSVEKGDPYAYFWEIPPATASIVYDLDYKWKDTKWMKSRKPTSITSVYEVHIGSWKKKEDNSFESLSYRELAVELVPYVKEMGFSHVELLPVMEHPYFPSWGYQITGYFAASSRFGTPQDLMFLIDKFHQAGIGVILDWVPSHFPTDAHGLGWFDGTHLYEHPDPSRGFHPEWKSFIFDYGRNEVRNFLFSNALFWLEYFHADGLRVDAVASILHLDYAREEGEWTPNKYGDNGNLEAIDFIKTLNETIHKEYPTVSMIAEESTAWPNVTQSVENGGLGFDQKWMMGWMNDTLDYFKEDPINRKYHQNKVTFGFTYAFAENYSLPLSHDEVVHGKGTLLTRMPGNEEQRFANLRLLFGFMFMHPGSNLIFMGGEFGQTTEWNIESGLDWKLLAHDYHKGVQTWVKKLNAFIKKESAVSTKQFDHNSFEWIDGTDHEQSILSFLRKDDDERDTILVVCNFTPVTRENYKIGVPFEGGWKEVLNSNDKKYGGSKQTRSKTTKAIKEVQHNRSFCVSLTLPGLSVIVLKKVENKKIEKKQIEGK